MRQLMHRQLNVPDPERARWIFLDISKYLKGKKMIVDTLQTTTAKTLKRRLESIEPSVKIRLLENSVWNDSLVNPVRNADICLMVKSASKHNMIDMISRTGNEMLGQIGCQH